MKKSYKMKPKKNRKFNYLFAGVAVPLFVFANVNLASASEITAENLTYLINRERIYYGLNPLKIDQDLNQAASLKSRDMINRNYFDHFGYGLTPWDFMLTQDYNYLYGGENLAMDFETAEGMVSAWLDSPTHRSNILSPDFEDAGIGIVKGTYTEGTTEHETIIVTNMFGRKKPPIVETFNKLVDGFKSLFSWR